MSKLIQRLLIFFIGIPAVLAIVLLSQYNHLLMHIVLLAVEVIALNELYGILKTKGSLQPKSFLLVLSVLPLIVSYVISFFGFSSEYIYMTFLLCSLLLVQLCALFLAAAEAQLALSFKRMLLPLLAVALPMLVLSAFCVAFDGIDAIVGLGNWSVATLCALPFVPTLYFCLRYLFLRFFDRTAK
jgi:hypothetical protein